MMILIGLQTTSKELFVLVLYNMKNKGFFFCPDDVKGLGLSVASIVLVRVGVLALVGTISP